MGSALRKYFSYDLAQPPSYNNIHLDFNSRFISSLSKESYKKLIYRFHYNFGKNEQKIIKNLFPQIRISTREDKSHFYSMMFNSSIIIATSNYTSFIQTFIINHPTMILWPEEFNALPKSVSPYFELLKEAGILYYSPEQCADKLNNIINNPLEWWLSDNVQSAKEKFCENVSKYTNDLGNELAHLLNKTINY